MKMTAFVAVLVSMTAVSAFSQETPKPSLLDGIRNTATAQWNDVKSNSGFKIESAMTSAFFDTTQGKKFAGVSVPFAHLGSNLFLAGGYAHTIGLDPRGMALVGPGLRLNDAIRPLVKKGLLAIPGLKNNTDLIAGLASAVSVGVQAGHDFNYTEREKIVFNRLGVMVGFEYAFGAPKSDAPTAQSSEKGWYLK